jgi:acyl-CoA synthetase (AMP-forming)/AMP-acid ligase II
MTLAERLRATLGARPDGLAIDFDGAAFTWGQAAAVARAIDAVLADEGVPPGAAVGLIARNRPTHVAAVWALFAAGRGVSMIHAFQSPDKLAEDIAVMRRPLVLAAERDWTPAAIAAAQGAGSAAYALTDNDAVPLRRVVAGRGAPAERADFSIEILGSGTTGKPKRVPIAQNAVEDMITRTLALYEQGGSVQAASLVSWLISNISGVNMILPPPIAGAPIAIQERFDAARFLDQVRRHRPAFLGVPPAVLAMLLQQGPSRDDLASVKIASTGSAPLDPAVRRQLENEYGIAVMCSYGATEFCGLVSGWPPEDMAKFAGTKKGSVGRALPGITIRIVSSDDGATLPAGETGLVEALVPRIGERWMRTNDLAYLDSDGFLHLVGRADDAIIRGGFKILPEEVQIALRRHPAVGDAAVMGLPDARLGQVPVCAVEPKVGSAPPSPADLEAFARQQLAAYQVPVRFVVVDALPRTGSMKISREGMRALFAS